MESTPAVGAPKEHTVEMLPDIDKLAVAANAFVLMHNEISRVLTDFIMPP
jgi:hypothetical protein